MNILTAFGFDDLRLLNFIARKRKIFRSCWGCGWLFFLLLGRFFSRFGLCLSLGSWHLLTFLAFGGIRLSRLWLRFLRFRLFWTRVVRILWFSHNSNESFKLCRLWLPDCGSRRRFCAVLCVCGHLLKCVARAQANPSGDGCRDNSSPLADLSSYLARRGQGRLQS